MRAIVVLLLLVLIPASPATQPLVAQDFSGDESPTLARRLTVAVGGAVLGLGLGYFASQVAHGDWDGPSDRTTWTAAGGAVGLVTGLAFPMVGKGPTGLTPGLPSGRDAIMPEELTRSGTVTAYDAVSSLRPEWLVLRGTRSWRETPRETRGGTGAGATVTRTADGIGTIQVYLDGTHVGNTEALRTIQMHDVEAIYFISPAAATTRWGAGHPHGAILVTLSGLPPWVEDR